MDLAKRFYRGAFGWRFSDYELPGRRRFELEDPLGTWLAVWPPT